MRRRKGVPRTVKRGNDFIERDGSIVGHWGYGLARLLSSRIPVIYKSEPLRKCGVCSRVGWNSVRERNAECRYGYPELYDWARQPLCVKCYFSSAKQAITQERIFGEEDREFEAMSELVRQFRIVINRPVSDRALAAGRFDERIRPTSIDRSKGRLMEQYQNAES